MQASIKRIDTPARLRGPQDEPKELYLRGTLPRRLPVAIVGSRQPTAYGRRAATAIAARLAVAGIPIISGLAFGIDSEAHRAALDSGGRTIAVLPSGLDDRTISPQTNLPLARRILEAGGALLSEYSTGTTARKEFYYARNRLISGLSRAVVVVEAKLPSGSLLTAGHAATQGRDVWALPGPIESPVSQGTNLLIADGAHPIVSVSEFLEALGLERQAESGPGLAGELSDQPVHVDTLAERLEQPTAEIEAELTKLEIRGLAHHVGGRFYVAA